MCSRSKEDRVPWIEQKAGFQFERIGPPQPKEMAVVAARRAVEAIGAVSDSVVPWFAAAARELLAQHGDAETALAKALAKVTGAAAADCVLACLLRSLVRCVTCGELVWCTACRGRLAVVKCGSGVRSSPAA